MNKQQWKTIYVHADQKKREKLFNHTFENVLFHGRYFELHSTLS